MTLGVPGDVLTAILLGALMIQGLTPGPLLFQEHGATVNGIFASFFVSNILILVVGLIAVRILGKGRPRAYGDPSCPSCSRCAP